MIRLLIGFVGGVYVGTYYNCKPALGKVVYWIKTNLPEEKKDGKKVDFFWNNLFGREN